MGSGAYTRNRDERGWLALFLFLSSPSRSHKEDEEEGVGENLQ